MIRRLMIVGLACLALACTKTLATNGVLTEVNTFGSSKVELSLDEAGKVKTLTAKGNGTNVMTIFTGLWDQIGKLGSAFLGSSEAPTININAGAPAPPTE